MDRIILEGIRLEIQVGVTEQERSVAQLCGLDVRLYVNLRPSGKSGELKKSVDYVAVFECIEAICRRRPYTLLEEVAEQLCAEILDCFPVEKIQIRVRKLHPFSSKLHAVGVDIKRSRKQLK